MRDALRRQVVRFDEVAHRFAEAGAKAVLVRAARAGGDAVDVAAQMLVGRFGPLQREIEAKAVASLDREGRIVDGRLAALGDDPPQVVDDALGVLEDVLRRRRPSAV